MAFVQVAAQVSELGRLVGCLQDSTTSSPSTKVQHWSTIGNNLSQDVRKEFDSQPGKKDSRSLPPVDKMLKLERSRPDVNIPVTDTTHSDRQEDIDARIESDDVDSSASLSSAALCCSTLLVLRSLCYALVEACTFDRYTVKSIFLSEASHVSVTPDDIPITLDKVLAMLISEKTQTKHPEPLVLKKEISDENSPEKSSGTCNNANLLISPSVNTAKQNMSELHVAAAMTCMQNDPQEQIQGFQHMFSNIVTQYQAKQNASKSMQEVPQTFTQLQSTANDLDIPVDNRDGNNLESLQIIEPTQPTTLNIRKRKRKCAGPKKVTITSVPPLVKPNKRGRGRPKKQPNKKISQIKPPKKVAIIYDSDPNGDSAPDNEAMMESTDEDCDLGLNDDLSSSDIDQDWKTPNKKASHVKITKRRRLSSRSPKEAVVEPLQTIVMQEKRCFRCPDENVFQSQELLNYHWKENHMDEKTFGCDQCSHVFSSKPKENVVPWHMSLWLSHAVNSHKLSVPLYVNHHPCIQSGCGFVGFTRAEYRTHFNSHLSSVLSCEHCNEQVQRTKWNSHVRTCSAGVHTTFINFHSLHCFLCPNAPEFSDSKEMVEHMRCHVQKSKGGEGSRDYLLCETCKQHFPLRFTNHCFSTNMQRTMCNLLHHLVRRHHLPIPPYVKSFTCDEGTCRFHSISFEAFRIHRRRHSAKVACYKCGVSFSQSTIRVHHRSCQIDESEKQVFSCTKCSKIFHSKFALSDHLVKKHRNEADQIEKVGENTAIFNCFACSYCCTRELDYLRHAYGKHKVNIKDLPVIQCEQCDYSHIHQLAVDKHRQKVHSITDFLCNVCGKVFKHRTYLLKHMESHQEAPLQCEYCAFTTNRQIFLQRHIEAQHQGKQYFCTSCSYSTGYSANLCKHRKTCKGSHRGARKLATAGLEADEPPVETPEKDVHTKSNAVSSDWGTTAMISAKNILMSSGQISEHEVNQMSDREIGHISERDMRHITQRDMSHLPKLDLNKISEHDMSHISERNMNQISEHNMSQISERGMGQISDHALNHISERDMSQIPERNINHIPERDISQMSDRSLSHMSEHNMGNITARDMSHIAERDMSHIVERAMSHITERAISHISETDINHRLPQDIEMARDRQNAALMQHYSQQLDDHHTLPQSHNVHPAPYHQLPPISYSPQRHLNITPH